MNGGGVAEHHGLVFREWQTDSMTRVDTYLAAQRLRRQTLAQRQQEKREDPTRNTDGTPSAEAAEHAAEQEPTLKRRRDETATRT